MGARRGYLLRSRLDDDDDGDDDGDGSTPISPVLLMNESIWSVCPSPKQFRRIKVLSEPHMPHPIVRRRCSTRLRNNGMVTIQSSSVHSQASTQPGVELSHELLQKRRTFLNLRSQRLRSRHQSGAAVV